MKKILYYVTAYAFAALMFAGCSNEPVSGTGEGRLVFSMNFGDGPATRAEAPENVVVKIGNNKGYTHIFDAGETIPSELWLAHGNYVIEVTGGTPADPGFEPNLLYTGRKEFSIAAGDTEVVEVECKVTTSMITIEFDGSIPQWTSGYALTLYPVADNDTKTVVFNEETDGETAYFDLAEEQTSIAWKFTATHEVDGAIVRNGTLSVLPGKHYEGTFEWTEGLHEYAFTITVDGTLVEIGDDFVIKPNLPEIAGDGFDIGLPQDSGEYTVMLTSMQGITDIVLSGSVFGAEYSALTDGVAATDLATYGITLASVTESNVTGYEMTLSQDFYNAITGKVTITAIDGRGNTQTSAFIKPSATFNPIADGAVWATKATVSGNATGDVKYAYRTVKNGVYGEWKYADTGLLTKLEPGTDYQVCIQVDGELASLPLPITTEAAPQLPNSGFEDYGNNSSGSGKIGYYFYPGDKSNIAEKFWDNGNAGTQTMSKNVTTPDADVRNGSPGRSSVKMQSQFVGLGSLGAFAAGNLYSGDFGQTRTSISNPSGTVHFGQPFTARPTAMSFYYKATTGSVNYVKAVAGQPLRNGDSDRYRVYIALVDDADYNPSAQGADGGDHWHTVDTADIAGTAPDFAADTRVIAFGSYDSDADVAEWTKHTIEIEYRVTNRIPTHIVVVASASMYGDYFTGSTSSIMWIDDFELVYE